MRVVFNFISKVTHRVTYIQRSIHPKLTLRTRFALSIIQRNFSKLKKIYSVIVSRSSGDLLHVLAHSDVMSRQSLKWKRWLSRYVRYTPTQVKHVGRHCQLAAKILGTAINRFILNTHRTNHLDKMVEILVRGHFTILYK